MSALENRIPPPVVMVLFALAMWAASRFMTPTVVDEALRLTLIAMSCLTVLLAPAAIMEFRRAGTTIDPIRIDRAARLVTSGVFGLTRNPMYVALTALLFALAFYLSVPLLLAGPVLFALFIDRFQIVPEERAMLKKFGADYEAYCARVGRWI